MCSLTGLDREAARKSPRFGRPRDFRVMRADDVQREVACCWLWLNPNVWHCCKASPMNRPSPIRSSLRKTACAGCPIGRVRMVSTREYCRLQGCRIQRCQKHSNGLNERILTSTANIRRSRSFEPCCISRCGQRRQPTLISIATQDWLFEACLSWFAAYAIGSVCSSETNATNRATQFPEHGQAILGFRVSTYRNPKSM